MIMKYPPILILAMGLALRMAAAQTTEPPTTPLFNFRNDDTGQPQERNWAIITKPDEKTGERGTATFEPYEDAEMGRVARLISQSKTSLHLVSPEITLSSDKVSPDRMPIGFQVEYRLAPDSGPVALVAGDGTHKYRVFLSSGTGKWEQQIITQFPRKKQKNPPLDLRKLQRILFYGSGNVDISFASVKLLYGERQAPLSTFTRPLTVVPQKETSLVLDGKLDDEAWKDAAIISGLPATKGEVSPEGFPTEVRVLRSGSRLLLGAKLRGEPEPFSGHSNGGLKVWRDSSFEVFLSPGDGDGDRFQIAINALNTREVFSTKSLGREWGAAWQSAVSKDQDGWTVEMDIDLTALDPSWSEQALWRWNVVRNVSTADKVVKLRAGLSGTETTPGALLAFAPAEARPDAKGFAMVKAGPTEYTLFLPIPLRETPGSVRIYRSNTGRPDAWAGTVEIAPNATFTKLELKDPGLYRLQVEQAGPDQRTQVAFLEFVATTSLQTQWDDIVLWPTPQKLELGKENLSLGRLVSVEQQGEGDTFPSEHLQEELERRYGPSGKGGNEKATTIRLHYDQNAKIPEEGYHLSVDADGVGITARSGRGMYYGVRTLLDLMEQSTLDLSKPQIRHVRIEDWPQIETRVCYSLMSTYNIPQGVEAMKRFIYKEVAGGRFNLLILTPRGFYKYAAAPEIAKSTAWSREQFEEVLDFARKHYIEVAPGGASPGHANWLFPSHPEFSDGSRKAVDLTNPEVTRKLLACYDELLDLFKPRYFHLGVDEWFPKLTENTKSPEEFRSLFLAHLKELYDHFKAKGVQVILWDDMFSPNWNGGPPLETAKMLKDLPKDIIIASWGAEHFTNNPAVYRELGFNQLWRVLTGFRPERADRSLEWWKDYSAVGLGLYIKWPWMTFSSNGNYRNVAAYTAGALHLNALLGWRPESLARGATWIMRNEGVHWMRTMSPPGLGRTDIRVTPVSLANFSGQSAPELLKPALEAFPGTSIGQPPYQFETKAGTAVFAVAPDKEAGSIPVNRKVAGLFFLHTANAAKGDQLKLGKQLARENRNPFGLEIGAYEIELADNQVERVPVVLGYNIHLFNAPVESAIMEGSPAFFSGEGGKESVTEEPATAWVLTWKNPRPEVPVKSVRFISSNESAPIALLGLSAAEINQ